MKILHVVRRYGPIGGMERYVWEVTRELAALGHQVVVICERCHAEKPRGISVHELGEIAPRPRWLSLLRFGGHVSHWLELNPHPGFVIHSNERLSVCDVTTFHGPPFATVRDKPIWKRLSLRVAMQFYLERRELSVPHYIVPNSLVIQKQLAHYYPEFAHKLTTPIVPGVVAMLPRAWKCPPADGGIIGFVGKEWQRKGLALAVEIVAQLRRERPKLELWVAGPQPQEVQHLFADWQGGYRLLGWRSDTTHLQQMDVLLHPARAEPYGMVIAEAMAAQASVVVSDACGAAAQVSAAAGVVLPLDAPLDQWVSKVRNQLQRDIAPPLYAHSWREVAQEYEKIYLGCIKEKRMNQGNEARYLTDCPVGCAGALMETDIVLPEGALLRCGICGQLLSQCSESRYWKSMEEFNDPQGTLPNARSIERRFRRSKKFLDKVSGLLGKAPADTHLLDVGCSSGAFLGAAAKLGYRAEGVEPASKAAATAQAAGLKVRKGLLHEAGYVDGEFDAATLFEVIEHLKEPQALLQECKRILRPGGILLIGTGNAASWSAAAMGAHWEYLDISKHGGHISFYTPGSLEKLAREAGFKVEDIQTRGVRFCDKSTCSEPIYTLAKIVAELATPLAALLNKGNDMAVYLRRM